MERPKWTEQPVGVYLNELYLYADHLESELQKRFTEEEVKMAMGAASNWEHGTWNDHESILQTIKANRK